MLHKGVVTLGIGVGPSLSRGASNQNRWVTLRGRAPSPQNLRDLAEWPGCE
jgi:hypothetical protein